VNAITARKIARRKRRIKKRLDAKRVFTARHRPMLDAGNIHYDIADRTRAIGHGGIGAVHALVRHVGLIDAIDDDLHLLKVHLPYHESDHVLNIAYNILCGNDCLQDLETLRNDEAHLDALDTQRIPDPTTAGDFCRRFTTDDQLLTLMNAINRVRTTVWKRQPASFFDRAILDADGTIAPTTGQCKRGMNISYDGQWGYHPLLISLANTKEPLYLVNRPANRPSHEQADDYLDRAVTLCRGAGFKSILLRGDTDFMQTWKLDGWDAAGDVKFIFGCDARKPMIARAESLGESLGESAWKRLSRPPPYDAQTDSQTQKRARPDNAKEKVVVEKKFRNFVLQWEDVAQFQHRPDKCDRTYRVIALRKKIDVMEGEVKLFDEYRYFFYITNDNDSSPEQIVFTANDRCDQENLIAQLKGQLRALDNPLDNLHSNWAYMVMASLAWTLKAWWGLLLPLPDGRWRERYERERRAIVTMEFKRFVTSVMRLPCQIIRSGRRLIYRLLSYNPWQVVLLRGLCAWRTPLRC
jgi:Transposase DDE domain group 1